MHLNAPARTDERGETRSHPAVIGLCMVITVIEGFNLIVYGSVIPLLLEDSYLRITDQQAGLVGGLVYIGAIAGSVLAPLAAERSGRKWVLIVAIALFAFGAVITGASISIVMLAVGRFVTGFGVGGALTTAMTVARNSAASSRASLVVTITMAGIPLGGVVASLLAIPVLPALGWRPMFFIGACTALVILAAVVIIDIPTDTPQEVAGRLWSGRQKIAALFTGRGSTIALVVAVCAISNMVAWQGLNVWAAQSIIDLGYTLNTALVVNLYSDRCRSNRFLCQCVGGRPPRGLSCSGSHQRVHARRTSRNGLSADIVDGDHDLCGTDGHRRPFHDESGAHDHSRCLPVACTSNCPWLVERDIIRRGVLRPGNRRYLHCVGWSRRIVQYVRGCRGSVLGRGLCTLFCR